MGAAESHLAEARRTGDALEESLSALKEEVRVLDASVARAPALDTLKTDLETRLSGIGEALASPREGLSTLADSAARLKLVDALTPELGSVFPHSAAPWPR